MDVQRVLTGRPGIVVALVVAGIAGAVLLWSASDRVQSPVDETGEQSGESSEFREFEGPEESADRSESEAETDRTATAEEGAGGDEASSDPEPGIRVAEPSSVERADNRGGRDADGNGGDGSDGSGDETETGDGAETGREQRDEAVGPGHWMARADDVDEEELEERLDEGEMRREFELSVRTDRRRSIREARREIQACRRRIVGRGAEGSSRLALSWRMRTQGGVGTIEEPEVVHRRGVRRPELEECVVEALSGLEFEATGDGADIEVRWVERTPDER